LHPVGLKPGYCCHCVSGHASLVPTACWSSAYQAYNERWTLALIAVAVVLHLSL